MRNTQEGVKTYKYVYTHAALAPPEVTRLFLPDKVPLKQFKQPKGNV